jgi:hypothetical protein
MVHQHGVGYILPAVILAGMIQILFGLCGMARLMRFVRTNRPTISGWRLQKCGTWAKKIRIPRALTNPVKDYPGAADRHRRAHSLYRDHRPAAADRG